MWRDYFSFWLCLNFLPKTVGAGSASPAAASDSELWAERFFSTHAEAFDYYERRSAEHPSARVHMPVHAQESDGAWAVCVDPVRWPGSFFNK